MGAVEDTAERRTSVTPLDVCPVRATGGVGISPSIYGKRRADRHARPGHALMAR
jgi:hypothetical protein